MAYRGKRKKAALVSEATLELLAKEGHDASAVAGEDYKVQHSFPKSK